MNVESKGTHARADERSTCPVPNTQSPTTTCEHWVGTCTEARLDGTYACPEPPAPRPASSHRHSAP